jgi:site-specific DNA-adenine methylase
MKSPIKWKGGKSHSVKTIVPIIPEHKCYVEPFFGGGWVFFAKEKSKVEVINDINSQLVNFYEVLRTQPKEFEERMKNVEFHNRINNTIEEILRRDNGEQATNDLIDSLEYIINDMKRITKNMKDITKI